MHGLGRPGGHPPGRPRRIVILLGGHRAGRRGDDHRLCLRPRRPRTERRGSRPAGRHRPRDRPAHPARARRRCRAVRPRRAFLGWTVRPGLRGSVSRPGRGHGPARRPAGRRLHGPAQTTRASTRPTGPSRRCRRRWPASASWDRSSDCPPMSRPRRPLAAARDEVTALPTVLRQASALTSLGDRPLIVVTAAAEADPGWVAAQEQPAPPVDRERPSGPGGRDPQLPDLGRRRRGLQPGDPRRRDIDPVRDGGSMTLREDPARMGGPQRRITPAVRPLMNVR